jgi:hypothetical protein
MQSLLLLSRHILLEVCYLWYALFGGVPLCPYVGRFVRWLLSGNTTW